MRNFIFGAMIFFITMVGIFNSTEPFLTVWSSGGTIFFGAAGVVLGVALEVTLGVALAPTVGVVLGADGVALGLAPTVGVVPGAAGVVLGVALAPTIGVVLGVALADGKPLFVLISVLRLSVIDSPIVLFTTS